MIRRLIYTLPFVGLLCAGVPALGGPTTGTRGAYRTWVPDEVILGLERGADLHLARLRRDEPRIRTWRSLSHCKRALTGASVPHPLACVRIAKLEPDSDVIAVARAVARIPGVAYAHPNYSVTPAYEPNDEFYVDHQYNLDLMRATQAWDVTDGRREIIVAVIDSGVRMDHEDLQDRTIWTNDDPINGRDDDRNGFVDDLHGWDFINDDDRPADVDGHGTHVTGIIAARANNALGVAGIAQVTVMPVRVFNGAFGTWEALTQAIFYAVDNGADVINFSGGGFGGDGLLQRAVEYARAHDVAIIAAAGNNGNDIPVYPAAYAATIAVAATGPDQVYYDWSSTGPHIDVAAPGVDILSTYAGHPSDYRFATGTSMAAAHVTGLVALMITLNPNLDVEQIRGALTANALDLGDAGFDQRFGFGLIDAEATLASLPPDTTPPFIVHDERRGTNPHSGYIDPRDESDDGIHADRGLDHLVVTFSEPVRDMASGDGGGLSTTSFRIVGPAAAYTSVDSIDAAGNPTIHVRLTAPIPPNAWTTLVADVEDWSGWPIEAVGNLGPNSDEPDRIDVGFLPGDVDQDGFVNPLDLLHLKRIILGTGGGDPSDVLDYADMDRNVEVTPLDLLRFRQLIRGQSPAIRPWAGGRLPPRP